MVVPYSAKDWTVRFVLAVVLGVTIPFCTSVFAQSSNDSPSILERMQNHQLVVDKQMMARQHAWNPEGYNSEDAVMHPIIYWRAWVNQPWPLHRIGALLFVYSVVAIAFQFFCPGLLAKSQGVYEQRWLRSLGLGLLVLILGGILTGFLARAGLFFAIANTLFAAVQFISLLGLCVAAKSIGRGFLTLVRIRGLQHVKGDLKTEFKPLLVGLFLCAIILIVGRFVPFLPGFGPRLLGLIASAGGGALLMAIRQSSRDI
jgi:hypothetical protein